MGAVHQHDDLSLDAGPVQVRSVINTRREQQDAVLVADWVVAVADGMGGHANGAGASRGALEALDVALDGPCDTARLAAGFDAANEAVRALADGTWRNAGSTLVALALDGDTVHGAWCGDSRAYLVAVDGTVSELTEDHVYPGGGLWSCLGDHGIHATFHVDTFEVPTGVGAKVLLSSDGVQGPVDDPEGIAELLAEGGIGDLVATAAGEGSDNATGVLVDVDAWAAAMPGERGWWLMAPTKVLDDAEWAEVRDAITQRYFGVDAATFAATIDTAGYDPDTIEEVLAYFPELD